MAFELRPAWCITDEMVDEHITFSAWANPDGSPASANDGDSWVPGQPLDLHRTVRLGTGPNEFRQTLGLESGIDVGIAARWTCRSTSAGGTHVGGPGPTRLGPDTRVELTIPSHVADHVEIETCLMTRWVTKDHDPDSPPDGSVLWSDAWSTIRVHRTITVEGSEARIPVRTMPFAGRYPSSKNALWTVEVDPGIEMDDLMSNSLTVILNETILGREFKDGDNEPDASRLPGYIESAVQVDVVTGLTAALEPELDERVADWESFRFDETAEGSIERLVTGALLSAFGSLETAMETYREGPEGFSRALWSTFAPNKWGGRK